ncbi:dihydroxyacetone kinase subunit DhaK [Paenibacillus sp. MSJ-34]|nr:dihydroxyacetone kinase subunit DhaK [Paenibacillus sp. MSJ-34]
MKKFINDPERMVDEMLEGYLLAHPAEVKSVRSDNRAIVRADAPRQGKVAIVTGGGSGHLPLFLGYVGVGKIDGVAVGDVFASPSPKQMLDATRAVDGGAGVLYIYGNYGGDVMNFDMAAEMADAEGIRVESVVATDDAASMPKGRESQRRGVAGLFYLYKLAAAKAEQGAGLDEVKRIAEKANANVRTIGVALSPCILPAVGKASFQIGVGEMEIGMGIHGEPGLFKGEIQSADDIAQQLVSRIFDDLALESGDRVSVLINGLGATPPEELYIIHRKVYHWLGEQGVFVHKSYVGEVATSLEMAGLSVSVLKLDEELGPLLDVSFPIYFN